MLLNDDAVADIEAQPRPVSRRFGGIEGVENFLLNVDGNSRSTVGYFDNDPVAVPVGFQLESAFAAHRSNRVIDEVGPHLVELAAKALNKRQILRKVKIDVEPVSTFFSLLDERVMQSLAHIDGLNGALIHVGVSFEGFDDLRDSPRAMTNLLE